jgi:hypothetical protein
LAGGTVTANGITIATSGFLSPGGFDADGAATMGGTIILENSSIGGVYRCPQGMWGEL